MEAKNAVAGGIIAALVATSGKYANDASTLEQQLQIAQTNLRMVESNSYQTCSLVGCSDPRASLDSSLQDQLKEACANECPRSQVLVTRGWLNAEYKVDPLLSLTQFWKNGKLECR